MKQVETQIIKVAITLDNGELAVMSFVTSGRSVSLPFGGQWFSSPEEGYWAREPTVENVQYEVNKTFSNVGRIGHQMPSPLSWQIVPKESVPIDRSYREAWIFNGKFDHDMPKAKQIHKDKLRLARNKKFIELDGLWMKAFATNNKQEVDRIEAERQVLRDLPQDPAIDTATTIEQLKALWPVTLG